MRRRSFIKVAGVTAIGSIGITTASNHYIEMEIRGDGSVYEVTSTDDPAVVQTGVANPTINLREGEVYKIDGDLRDHPLRINDAQGNKLASQDGPDGSIQQDIGFIDSGGTVYFDVTTELVDRADSYVCQVHPQMTGSMTELLESDPNINYTDPDGQISIVNPEGSSSFPLDVDVGVIGGFELQDRTLDDTDQADGKGHLHVFFGDPVSAKTQFGGDSIHLSEGGTSVEVTEKMIENLNDTTVEELTDEVTLSVQAADHDHFAYDLSDSITIDLSNPDPTPVPGSSGGTDPRIPGLVGLGALVGGSSYLLYRETRD